MDQEATLGDGIRGRTEIRPMPRHRRPQATVRDVNARSRQPADIPRQMSLQLKKQLAEGDEIIRAAVAKLRSRQGR